VVIQNFLHIPVDDTGGNVQGLFTPLLKFSNIAMKAFPNGDVYYDNLVWFDGVLMQGPGRYNDGGTNDIYAGELGNSPQSTSQIVKLWM